MFASKDIQFETTPMRRWRLQDPHTDTHDDATITVTAEQAGPISVTDANGELVGYYDAAMAEALGDALVEAARFSTPPKENMEPLFPDDPEPDPREGPPLSPVVALPDPRKGGGVWGSVS